MKRLSILAIVLTVLLCGCAAVESTGPKAPEIKIERRDFIETQYMQAKEAVDCSEVVAFVEDLNGKLSDTEQITDYDMYYDKDAQTVYVTSDITTLAFRLDNNGSILFTSCTGPYETKAAISQGIAKTYASSFSSNVEALFATVEAQTWLNDLNSSYINKAVSGFSMKDLDTTLTATQPDVPELKTYDGFPTITEALDNAKLMDLENYFESPTLQKFWKDVDISTITEDLTTNDQIGDAIRNQFNNTTVTAPDASSDSISSIINPTNGTQPKVPSQTDGTNSSSPAFPSVSPTTPTTPSTPALPSLPDTSGERNSQGGNGSGIGQGFNNMTPGGSAEEHTPSYDQDPLEYSETNDPI